MMKRLLLCTALLAISAAACAQTTPPDAANSVNAANPYSAPAPLGRTRTEVLADLVQAQRAGIVPSTEAQYPMDARTAQINQQRYASREKWWHTHGVE
jgi:hypothetical protein